MLPRRLIKPEATMENLPEELKLEILLRLPVSSLVSLKRVSKSWSSRISNPNFAKLHLQLSNYSQHPNRILLTTSPQMTSIDTNASLHNDSDTFNLVSPPFKPNNQVCVVGSCRGIVLLQIENKDLFLWNPVIGAYKNIALPLRFKSPIPFAFCYDESLDEYFIGLSYRGNFVPQVFEVLYLRTNSWEKLDLTHHYRVRFQNRGTIFNGAIHFLTFSNDRSHISPELIAFDVTTKDLRTVPSPSGTNLQLCIELEVHKGCLSLAEVRENEIHIWLMREYGVKSSWTKLFSLSRHLYGAIGYFHLLLFFKEGDEFVTSYFTQDGEHGLSKWNVRGEMLEHRSYGPSLRSYIEFWSRAIAYTETLLPLP